MKRLVLLSLVGWGAAAGAAETQMWNEVGLAYRATKTVSVAVAGQLRFDQDLSRLANQIGEAGVQWRAQRWLRLGLGYRLENEKNKKDVWRRASRPHVDARFKHRLGAVSLAYRLRWQEKTEEKANGDEQTASLRHRLSLGYTVSKKLRPSASAELFTRFDQGLPRQLFKLRLTASLPYKLSGKHTLKSFVRLQVPIAKADDPLEQIIGLGYELSLKR